MFLFMTRLPRFVAVAVLLGGSTVFLSACSDSSEPVVSPTPVPVVVSDSPTPSASPTPTALSDEELLELIPESARLENFGSAVNFARFFILLYPEMMQTKDSQLFAQLSGVDCVFCQSSLGSVDELVASGGSVTGGEIEVNVDSAAGGLQSDGTWNASFDATTTDSVFFDVEGVQTSLVPGQTGRLGVALRFDGGHWVVLGVGSEAP